MKKELRKGLLQKRDSIPDARKAEKDRAIKESLFALDEFKRAKNVLMYVSFRSEVDTLQHLDEIIGMGKKLVVPLVNSKEKTLTLFEIKSPSELKPGYMGIPEPAVESNREMNLDNIDIVIIPGSGFDPAGNRLGYGGGYYDRMLEKAGKHIPAVALAYEEQITEKIPAEPHDIKMDIIITDNRTIYRDQAPTATF